MARRMTNTSKSPDEDRHDPGLTPGTVGHTRRGRVLPTEDGLNRVENAKASTPSPTALQAGQPGLRPRPRRQAPRALHPEARPHAHRPKARRPTLLPALHHPAQEPSQRRPCTEQHRGQEHPRTPDHRHAVVLKTPREDHTVYQEEIRHRTDISHRLQERRNHRRRRARSGTGRRGSTTAGGRRPAAAVGERVSNEEHRIARLFERSGASAAVAVVQDSKFDTRKNPRPDGQRPRLPGGPAVPDPPASVHPRTLEPRCAYCAGVGSRTHFELDHVVPRSKGGPTNIGNLVWACRPCNQAKTTLAENPERSTAVLHRAHHRKPLTAAGAIAWICQTLVRRLQSRELTVRTTNRRRHRRHPKAARNPEEPRRRRHLLRDRPSRHPATGAREAQGRGPRPPQADQRPCRRHRTCTGG